MKRRLQMFFMWLAVHTWVRLLMLRCAKMTIEGRENVPSKGAVIMASNHLNNADPPLVASAVGRPMVWVAKQEWLDTPVAGWLMAMHGVMGIRRHEADLGAVRRATTLLNEGAMLAMFPEGTRSKTGTLGEAEPGTALLALRSGVPILPVAIWGTEKVKLPRDLLRRQPGWVRIGEPFTLPASKRVTRQQIEAGTREIMERIAALLPEQYRGRYAGRDAVVADANSSN